MAEPDVVPALVALGFSLNESRAYAALLLARRGERGIRPRILDLMDTAGREDFHALALAMEALDALA